MEIPIGRGKTVLLVEVEPTLLEMTKKMLEIRDMTDIDESMDTVEEGIWALEEAYFSNLYKADYEAVRAIVHSRFLGWPGTSPHPIDREASTHFMKRLVSKPTSCALRIERGGIQVLAEVALTQYTLHADFDDTPTGARTQSSRITHTWVKEGHRWELLGGMSCDR